MPFGIGPLELIIVLVIILLIFGARRVPELGRSLGSGMREFKDSIAGKDDDEDKSEKTATKTEADKTKPPELSAAADEKPAERVDDAEVVSDSAR